MNKYKLIHNFGRREEVVETDQESNAGAGKRSGSEPKAQNGNYIGKCLFISTSFLLILILGNADKPLKYPKHVNDEIEKELITFK